LYLFIYLFVCFRFIFISSCTLRSTAVNSDEVALMSATRRLFRSAPTHTSCPVGRTQIQSSLGDTVEAEGSLNRALRRGSPLLIPNTVTEISPGLPSPIA